MKWNERVITAPMARLTGCRSERARRDRRVPWLWGPPANLTLTERHMNATQAQAEQTLADTPFGTVTNRRVIYFRSKSWFGGGSREDIPLQHVTSVRLDTSRSILVGALLLLGE